MPKGSSVDGLRLSPITDTSKTPQVLIRNNVKPLEQKRGPGYVSFGLAAVGDKWRMHASGLQPLVRVLSSSSCPKSISCTPLFGGFADLHRIARADRTWTFFSAHTPCRVGRVPALSLNLSRQNRLKLTAGINLQVCPPKTTDQHARDLRCLCASARILPCPVTVARSPETDHSSLVHLLCANLAAP
jgi:hypothetical protein